MKITYLHHSGFYINTGKNSFLIDFYQDVEKGFTESLIKNDKSNIYILASHFHGDHFNKEIFNFKDVNPHIRYIFGSDIFKEKKAKYEDGQFLSKGNTYSDGNIVIKAYGSTDSGISFYIEADGYKIFHAGDLNNWHWKEECDETESAGYEYAFHKELSEIKADNLNLDVTFFPVDPRLGKEYFKGPEEFISNVKTRLFVPMHFGDKFDLAKAFEDVAMKYCDGFFVINKKGDSMEWK
ncbi:MAG: MBL fold metallo-hydrolase [Clostridiales bacterium]|jgi:L-ascorbate metabolism protein UlaG (beta-lactamase superfamily)|nr:MBL fold metallo-hydrolase [Clostridiales bacterium]